MVFVAFGKKGSVNLNSENWSVQFVFLDKILSLENIFKTYAS